VALALELVHRLAHQAARLGPRSFSRFSPRLHLHLLRYRRLRPHHLAMGAGLEALQLNAGILLWPDRRSLALVGWAGRRTQCRASSFRAPGQLLAFSIQGPMAANSSSGGELAEAELPLLGVLEQADRQRILPTVTRGAGV